MKTVAERIRSAREAKGITQEQVAGVLGVSRQQVGNYESGKSEPGSEGFVRLADYLRVDVAWLVSGRGDMELPPRTTESARRQREEESTTKEEYRQKRSPESAQGDERPAPQAGCIFLGIEICIEGQRSLVADWFVHGPGRRIVIAGEVKPLGPPDATGADGGAGDPDGASGTGGAGNPAPAGKRTDGG